MSEESAAPRGRGRPRLDIDLAVVTEVAVQIFSERGYEAVSIESVAAELEVSRATLYRTVPTKDALMELLFERGTADLYAAASEVSDANHEPAEALSGLIHVHVDAAIRMGPYMTVFYGGSGLGPRSLARWRRWTHKYEKLWVATVKRAMRAGVLPEGDPVTTTRLLLGMLIWVSRWHGATKGVSGQDIADTAVRLVSHQLTNPDGGSRKRR